jgi:hypothetical protein
MPRKNGPFDTSRPTSLSGQRASMIPSLPISDADPFAPLSNWEWKSEKIPGGDGADHDTRETAVRMIEAPGQRDDPLAARLAANRRPNERVARPD